MKQEFIQLWKEGDSKYAITRYVREGRNADAVRPAMLVVPGGGYSCVCRSTEGIPIANKFYELGFNVFILEYHVNPTRFPEPQQDIFRAIRLIRYNAAKWHVNPNNIAAVGFSAGGHLVASAGTLFHEIQPPHIDEADSVSSRPDAILLAYPVITFGKYTHMGTANCLCDGGKMLDEWREHLSLENRVPEDAPPTFMWHTITDQAVPFQNSTMFLNALTAKNIPAELHMFPFGRHGMQLGYGDENIQGWPEQAVTFLKTAAHFTFPTEEPEHLVYLTFDDATKNHLSFVAPLLQKYNFGATFFICRFTDEWRSQHNENLLTGEEILKLHKMGFAIGNHTWSHPALTNLDYDQITEEISTLNNFLTENGIPTPNTFAYPGGPFSEKAAEILPHYQIFNARTTENDYITKDTQPLRIPSWPMQGDCFNHFKEVVDATRPGKAVCILFHGVPDIVHPWVNTTPEVFTQCMEYLASINATVKQLTINN